MKLEKTDINDVMLYLLFYIDEWIHGYYQNLQDESLKSTYSCVSSMVCELGDMIIKKIDVRIVDLYIGKIQQKVKFINNDTKVMRPLCLVQKIYQSKEYLSFQDLIDEIPIWVGGKNGSYWTCGLTGELGELSQAINLLVLNNKITENIGLICNSIKKSEKYNSELNIQNISEEIADTFIYLAILSRVLGINMETSIIDKLKKVKEK